MTEEEAGEPTAGAPAWRQADYRYSTSFPELLREARCSLLVSTYQAGKLVGIGVNDEGLNFSFQSFDQAMGVAVRPSQVAVGARGQIWFLGDNSGIAFSIEPAGRFDRCYLPRWTKVTGAIHCHELAWGRPGEDGEPELWVVNTLFSCLANLKPAYNFVPRWRPPFVSGLAAEDRCHLNGLAMRDGVPAFVTAMAQTDHAGGWRENKNETGCVIDVSSGEVVTTGLAMPHSPRWHQGRLLVLNSGRGQLESIHLDSGSRALIASLPGYARGLACYGDLAFVGLSRIRETAVFGGVPIAARHEELKCGVGVIDLRTGTTLATLEFESGVEEIFDVQVLPETRCPALSGEQPEGSDPGKGQHEIWIVPPEPSTPSRLEQASTSPPGAPAPTAASDVEVAGWLSEAIRMQTDFRRAEALSLFHKAALARPESAEVLNHLGNALQDTGQQGEALRCYRRAATVDPSFVPALQNLGYLLVNRGLVAEGVEALRRAQALAPTPINRALIATALPVVPSSEEDLRARRARLEEEVQAMVDDGVEIDTTSSLVPTSFFTAYAGMDDRDLQRNLGRIFRGPDVTREHSRPRRRERPRVGFLSAYFRDHTIGRLNAGRITGLSRERFEVVVLSVGDHSDELSARFEAGAERFLRVPRDVAAARDLIMEQELDLLVFTDVGMDALTYTLSFSRMAPVQCATWGHPTTTGSPHMDAFLSSELLEADGADEHYTERLLRPPTLCTLYERPSREIEPVSRAELGLREEANLYLCPQTLFKFHPDFDRALAAILDGDPEGVVVLIEGRVPEWTAKLDERLRREISDASRLQWVEPLPRGRFLGLLAEADVILDTFHFGGGNTTYEALAFNKPVVTLPSEFLRGRITRALYEKAGYTDLVADSPQGYVELALALGTDRERRASASAEIEQACSILYDDAAELRDFEECLAALAAS